MIHGFRFRFLLPLLVLPVLLGCCKKDDPKPAIEQLPPATTTGANTFGCLVNGEVWKVTSTSTFGNRLVADWTVSDGLGISIVDRTSQARRTLLIYLPDFLDNPLGVRAYSLGDSSSGYTASFTNIATSYEYDRLLSGRVTLTRLDRTARICSGTFDFVMANGTDTLRVTDGRFDIRDMLL